MRKVCKQGFVQLFHAANHPTALRSSDRICANVLLDPIHANAKLEPSRSRTAEEGNRVQPAASITVSPPTELRAAVLLPLPLPTPYDYALPSGIMPKRGMLVRAPLGARELIGIVWGKPEGSVAQDKLRIAEPLDDFRVPAALCDFIDWVARYTLSPPGAVLAQALRVRGGFDAEMPRRALAMGAATPPRMTPARERVLKLMQDGRIRSVPDITEQATVGSGVG